MYVKNVILKAALHHGKLFFSKQQLFWHFIVEVLRPITIAIYVYVCKRQISIDRAHKAWQENQAYRYCTIYDIKYLLHYSLPGEQGINSSKGSTGEYGATRLLGAMGPPGSCAGEYIMCYLYLILMLSQEIIRLPGPSRINVTGHEKIGLMCTQNLTTFLNFKLQ